MRHEIEIGHEDERHAGGYDYSLVGGVRRRYFEVAQLVRVSSGTYRALEPAVNQGVLNLNVEQIGLTVENSRNVDAAVSGLRRSLVRKKPEPELGINERLERLDRLCSTIIEEFSEIPRRSEEPTRIYKSALVRLQAALTELRREFGF